MLLKWKANTISSIKPQIPTTNRYLLNLPYVEREEIVFGWFKCWEKMQSYAMLVL